MKLEFDCKEKDGSMRITERGHFCLKCQHEVIDFTNWDQHTLLSYLKLHPDTCGSYRPEQLEPELIPLSELISLKAASLVAGLTLGSIHVSAQAPASVTPEMSFAQSYDDTHHDTVQEPVQSVGDIGTCISDRATRKEQKTTRQHRAFPRIYFSKRFPFLKVRKRILRGRLKY